MSEASPDTDPASGRPMRADGGVYPMELSHHWLVGMRGGEKVLEQFCLMFPDAPVRTLVHDPERLSGPVADATVAASLLNRLPLGSRLYKQLLPLHPLAIGLMRVPDGVRFQLCTDASMIKGIRVPDDCFVACYCHSPPRYLYGMQDDYTGGNSLKQRLAQAVFAACSNYCRRFDRKAAQRVDRFIANSQFVADRIKRHYDRDAVVVNPPVDVQSFEPDRPRDDFYLVVSEITPYKRIDLAVEAFRDQPRRLVVIGDGPLRSELQADAPPNVTFLGRAPFEVLKSHYETCRAFVFPGVEDFGITPLEAQASGAPVVALGKGGALETVIDGETGVFFPEQTPASLREGLERVDALIEERGQKDLAAACRAHSLEFSPDKFRRRMIEALEPDLTNRSIPIATL